ncbi:unnamed protein product [Closterium sp. NIES-65]|nr:unnamed protein product [Closterium sp. NIES-65]
MADYHSSATTLPSLSPSLHRGLWRSQRRRCSLLPRPASRNNFSEQGEGERAREVATTAKRSGGERARRWLMDELGALGVDSGEEKWVRWRVGVGEVRSGRLGGSMGESSCGNTGGAEVGACEGVGRGRGVWGTLGQNMGGSMSGSFIDTNMSGGGGIAGPGRQGHPGMEGVRRPQAGTGSIGSTRSTGSIGRRSASMDVSRRCWQSMPFSLTDASSSLGFPQHRQHGSAAVPTMVAAVAWWAAVWSAVTASACSTSSAAASSTAATFATAAPTATAAPASASTAATNAPTPGTTPTATPTPSAAFTTASTAPAGSSSAPAPLALASATSLARGRRCTDRLKTNKVSRSSRGNRGQERRGGAPLKDRGTRVTKRGSYSDYALLRC